MPAALIEALKKSFAKRKGKLRGVDEGRYVYGAMNRRGWMRGSKETEAGRRVEAKYEKDHGV